MDQRIPETGRVPIHSPRAGVIRAARPATTIAFLVAYGELAIGVALVIGFYAKTASAFGFIYMVALLFSSNYPGPNAPLWQYFGASLDHSVLALCFLAFIIGQSDERLSLRFIKDQTGSANKLRDPDLERISQAPRNGT